jgi:hypothetical protein
MMGGFGWDGLGAAYDSLPRNSMYSTNPTNFHSTPSTFQNLEGTRRYLLSLHSAADNYRNAKVRLQSSTLRNDVG